MCLNSYKSLKTLILSVSALLIFNSLDAQDLRSDSITVKAGPQYSRSDKHQKRWGSHYRKEWDTPVKIKIVNLDTLAGGLTPYLRGGGRQSKTLRLHDSDKREYVLRSIDKSFGGALPEIYRNTFLEDIINDQVSIAHPYAAITIPPLINAVGVYHTRPEIVFIPKQPALDSFNSDYADQLFLFEQRPDENWETAPNFGRSKNIVGTDRLMEKLEEDSRHLVHQEAYVKARLFDMFIGDWGRHEDQWRWAEYETEHDALYIPIPRDRDQVWTKFDGKWLNLMLSIGGLDHLQSFDSTIENVPKYNFPARHLDRRMANEPDRDYWLGTAREMQKILTDSLIEAAVHLLPPEVYPISGPEIIAKLKGRRNRLHQFAEEYYLSLAKAVDVVGSDKKEIFKISGEDSSVLVEMFVNDDEGPSRVYRREFLRSETEEIRIYGRGDDDKFELEGKIPDDLLIRVIGGAGNDEIINNLAGKNLRKNVHAYDNRANRLSPSNGVKLHISNDSLYNRYHYDAFEYDKKGFGITPGFFSISLGYNHSMQKWGRQPAGSEHGIKFKFSISRAALNLEYNGIFYRALGFWDFIMTAGAGFPSVDNFFGVGNETSFDVYKRRYFRLRKTEFYSRAGIARWLTPHNRLEFSGFYHTIKILEDDDRVVSDFLAGNGVELDRKHFAGAMMNYKFMKVDHPVVARSGFRFDAGIEQWFPLNGSGENFTRLSGSATTYIPLGNIVSLNLRVGAATLEGMPDFYLLNRLGSEQNLRGYRDERFYAKTIFYNNNELRLHFNARTRIFNGKWGGLGFYDIGRAWHPGEVSGKWHPGYGFGAFIAPFNRFLLYGTREYSPEDAVWSASIGYFF